jgi:hypothetical protein
MKVEFSQQIFEQSSNIKFHENLSSGSRGVPCGRTGRHTDMTKLIVAFRNIANAPKNTHKVMCMAKKELLRTRLKKYLHSKKKIVLRTRNHCFAACHIRDLI